MVSDITASTPGYCERSDVEAALQETSQQMDSTPLGDTNVDAAIVSASRWFRRRSKAHFYDSNATGSDLITDSAASATDIQLSIPSSPHPQSGQFFKVGEGTLRQRSYPVTNEGQYSRAKQKTGSPGLPYRYVESIDALDVRELGGETNDWVADSAITQGRGEDYYLVVDGGDSMGRSYLYLRAGAIGPRLSFDGIATADITYGRDWQDAPWPDVRRGVAHLASAELVVDDDVLTRIPDNGGIVNVTTEAEEHLNAAMDRYLGGYLEVQVA